MRGVSDWSCASKGKRGPMRTPDLFGAREAATRILLRMCLLITACHDSSAGGHPCPEFTDYHNQGGASGAKPIGSLEPGGATFAGSSGALPQGTVTVAFAGSSGSAGQPSVLRLGSQAPGGESTEIRGGPPTPLYGACSLVPKVDGCLVARGKFRAWEWSQASGCWPQQIGGRALVFSCYSSAAPLRLEGQFVWMDSSQVMGGCQLCDGYSGMFADE